MREDSPAELIRGAGFDPRDLRVDVHLEDVAQERPLGAVDIRCGSCGGRRYWYPGTCIRGADQTVFPIPPLLSSGVRGCRSCKPLEISCQKEMFFSPSLQHK